LTGYLALKSAYEEQIAAQEVQEGISISGRNPAQNREIERTELKKQALFLLTNTHFDYINAMEQSVPDGYPEPELFRARLLDPWVRFFEQAFEWPQMTYLFYPYFWGRKAKWSSLIQLEDNDPLHAQFIRAGAARVTVPVRPGFEPSIVHYLETGALWGGMDPPPCLVKKLMRPCRKWFVQAISQDSVARLVLS
jgi:hypothetical protein